jgi:hypothetical protein
MQDRTAVVGVEARRRRGALAVDPDHLGAHVGQQHRGEGCRPEAGELDDPESR